MKNAADLVRSCTAAGFCVIHLDTGMKLADDPAGPLAAETAASLTAALRECPEVVFEGHS